MKEKINNNSYFTAKITLVLFLDVGLGDCGLGGRRGEG
jgi:hypothetical protein